jgi:hypothetical protein
MDLDFCRRVLAELKAGTLVLSDEINEWPDEMIDWLCRDVLPSIRKTGRYDLPSEASGVEEQSRT